MHDLIMPRCYGEIPARRRRRLYPRARGELDFLYDAIKMRASDLTNGIDILNYAVCFSDEKQKPKTILIKGECYGQCFG